MLERIDLALQKKFYDLIVVSKAGIIGLGSSRKWSDDSHKFSQEPC